MGDINANSPNVLSLPAARLLEGIVTTVNADGTTNISPMGPLVDQRFERLLLRPFQTSTTFLNLRDRGEGVLHVTDDVELLARAAVHKIQSQPMLEAIKGFSCPRLADTCRWYAFQVESIDDRDQRTRVAARVVQAGRVRDFFGFNRAKHAVVEAAILATRVHLLPPEEIRDDVKRLSVLVEKTGGEPERRAFALLEGYVSGETDPPRIGDPGRPFKLRSEHTPTT